MTTSDVQIIYSQLVALQEEVRGYRLELNGRLRHLEQAEHSRVAIEQAALAETTESRAHVGFFIFGTSAIAATIGSIVSLIVFFI